MSSLLVEGKWLGTMQTAVFEADDWVTDGIYITLPRGLQTLEAATIRGNANDDDNRRLCQWRSAVKNEWYQFIPGSLGLVLNPPCDTPAFVAQGDNFLTFRNLPAKGKLRITTTAVEAAALTFAIRGYLDGQKVFSSSGTVEGESLTIPIVSGTSATTTSSFDEGDSLYSIIKSPTVGLLNFYLVSDSDSSVTKIGQYEPGELLPCYRRYLVPTPFCNEDGTGDNADNQLITLCKRRYVPVVVDNDEIYPGNINALEMALSAIKARRSNNLGDYRDFMGQAISLLNSELDDANAEQSYGTVQMSPFSSMAYIPSSV